LPPDAETEVGLADAVALAAAELSDPKTLPEPELCEHPAKTAGKTSKGNATANFIAF
jgi:hypothetical protein